MTHASPHMPLSSSHLVTSLARLVEQEGSPGPDKFVEQLAQLIDLADALKLAAANDRLFRMEFRPDFRSAEDVRKEFARVKRSIVVATMRSFEPAKDHIRVRLPQAPAVDLAGTWEALQPYTQFYSALQRQLEFNVQRLQEDIRSAVSGLSLNMARLAALDTTLHNTLQSQARQYFAAIPNLLGKRFAQLTLQFQQQHADASDRASQWQLTTEQFVHEMRGIVLAETDARLLPVQGLVEAINQSEDKKP